MKLDELRTVQSKERRKDSLQQLRDSFYEDVAAYLQDLKASRDRRAEQVADPFSDSEVRQLSDELETAEEVAEAIYERRVGKVVKLASFAAADMPVDDEGMTGEERRLFDDLVSRIERNKTAVLDVLSGNTDSETPTERTSKSSASQPTATEPTPPPSPTERLAESETAADAEADGMLADAMGGGSEPIADGEAHPGRAEADTVVDPSSQEANGTGATDPSPAEIPPPEAEPEPDAVLEPSTDGGTATDVGGSPASPGSGSPADRPESTSPTASEGPTTTDNESGATTEPDDDDRTTLRITKNVGEIFGVDGREYTLRSEDVVTLPTTNAEPLVERDAAMRLD